MAEMKRLNAKESAVLTSAVTAICEIMRTIGISKVAAQRQLALALIRGYERGPHRPGVQPRPITQLADVCTRWHIERAYADKFGKPKPLTWNGRTGSLLKLAAKVAGKDRAPNIVRLLISRRLVRRTHTGLWIPKSQIVSPKGFDSAQALR